MKTPNSVILYVFLNGKQNVIMLDLLLSFVGFLLYPVSNASFSLFFHSRWVTPRNLNQW